MSFGNPTESPFAPQNFQPYQQPKKSRGGSWLLGLLLVGLGVFTLGGVLCIAGIWYVATNVDRWLVGYGREAMVAMINESEVPAAEKRECITQVDRVVTAYKERKIKLDDLQKALSQLEESPAIKVLSLYGLDDVHLTGSELTADEIAEGRRTYQRAMRGVYEGKFTEDDFYAALPDEGDSSGAGQNANAGNGQVTLVADSADKPIPTDDLRESLVKLKIMADNAGIPDEPFQLDIGDEVKKLVDQLLAGKN